MRRTPDSLDQELQQLKEEFQRSAKSKDRASLEGILHDDYSFIGPEGTVFDKPTLIDNIVHPTTNFLSHNFRRAETNIAVSADGRTVTEAADVDLIGDLRGEDRTGKYINTATYVKGLNGWQIMGNTITQKEEGTN